MWVLFRDVVLKRVQLLLPLAATNHIVIANSGCAVADSYYHAHGTRATGFKVRWCIDTGETRRCSMSGLLFYAFIPSNPPTAAAVPVTAEDTPAAPADWAAANNEPALTLPIAD